jgi:primosomal replication protein N
MDKNTVSLSGVICSTPVLSKISHKTQQVEFYILIKEWYLNKDNHDDYKESRLKIEVLGKNSDHIARTFKNGQRVCVEGYLRQTGELITVRAFTVFNDYSALLCGKSVMQEILDDINTLNDLEKVKQLLEQRISAPVLKR